jgi:O-succinylbenzoic acid--CoA ligase
MCAAHCGPAAGTEAGLVGRLLPGFEAETGPDGRLRLRGPALTLGYANPDCSPGEGLEGGWLTSNDLARFDGEGRLWVSGRADEVLVSGGELVHPAQVEALLAACPGVRAVAVGAIPDPRWGDLLVAWYRGELEPGELETWCRERLPGYLRPRRLRRVARLPLSGSGKLDRTRLRELMAAEEGGSDG